MKTEIFKTKKSINNTKIAILADIHYCHNYKKAILDNIEKQLSHEKPQYLIIAGDILDKSNYEYQELIEFFKRISEKITIIAILGNHDFYYQKNKKEKICQLNEKFIKSLKNIKNTYLLRDEKIIINNICFYGFDLSYNHYEKDKESYSSFCQEISKLKTSLDDNYYNITIIHSPVNIYRYIRNNPTSHLSKSDLIISGHTHNGILPYWFTNITNKLFKSNRSLISPYRLVFPKYAQGRVYKPVDGIIYEGLIKLSKSSNFFSNFDFLFHKTIQIIEIKKEP